MKRINLTLLLLSLAMLVWTVVNTATNAHAQGSGPAVRILGLGPDSKLPSRSDGTVYLPVGTENRQLTIHTETWQNNGDIVSLLLDSSIVPKDVIVCGHRLTMIQGSMRNTPTDDTAYFALTINGTGQNMPGDGCFSITPVAFLRIKGVAAIPRAQLPVATIIARY